MREGDLQIRDPDLTNTALGCKILWKLHSDPNHPVNKTLRHKYIPNAKLRNLQNTNSKRSTLLWQLYIKGFSQNLYHIPGNQTKTLKEELREVALVHKTEKDKWGWGPTGVYSSAKGYELLQSHRDRSLPARFWMEVWDPLALPKVNLFFWILMHKKILTGENLLKRKIAGLYRCSLCKEAMETMDHLFVDCSFANKVWTLILQGLKAAIPTKISFVDLFLSWKYHYPLSSLNSSWARIWITIPKFVCWKLLLARNEQIFNNVAWTPNTVTTKAKALLLETLNSQKLKDDSSVQ
eukprot:PITA_22763